LPRARLSSDLLPATIVLIVPAMAAIAMGGDHIEAQSR
jgi:hypothetical protein